MRFTKSFLILLFVIAGIKVTLGECIGEVPMTVPYTNFTEEIWIYINQYIPNENTGSLELLSNSGRYSIKISSKEIIYSSPSKVTFGTTSGYPIKTKRWMNIATSFGKGLTVAEYSLFVDGLDFTYVPKVPNPPATPDPPLNPDTNVFFD